MKPRLTIYNKPWHDGNDKCVGILLIVRHINIHTFQVVAPLVTEVKCGLKIAVYDDGTVPQPFHLSFVLNKGIDYLVEDKRVEYVSWIHDDMYFMHDWVTPLISELEADKSIGKIGPVNPVLKQTEGHKGNQNPWIMPRNIALKYRFDEIYIGIGGFEDWDLNSCLERDGYKVWISPVTWVAHKDRGTRRYHDWSVEEAHNKKIYDMRWGGKRW